MQHNVSLGEDIQHFEMAGLFPTTDWTLAVNTRLGTVSLLASSSTVGHATLLVEQQFGASEMSALYPLITSYPHYCPYEELLASFSDNNMSEENIARHRLRLEEALYAGVWDYEMRPLRNVLSRARFKLRDFDIEISSILATGYTLIYWPPGIPKRRRKGPSL